MVGIRFGSCMCVFSFLFFPKASSMKWRELQTKQEKKKDETRFLRATLERFCVVGCAFAWCRSPTGFGWVVCLESIRASKFDWCCCCSSVLTCFCLPCFTLLNFDTFEDSWGTRMTKMDFKLARIKCCVMRWRWLGRSKWSLFRRGHFITDWFRLRAVCSQEAKEVVAGSVRPTSTPYHYDTLKNDHCCNLR